MSYPNGRPRIYLDHAATMPVSDAARAAWNAAAARWANPSSPHAEGRAARAMLEDARARVGASLGWRGHVILTSGASEAIVLALMRGKAGRRLVSPVEHDAVLRMAGEGAGRLHVDEQGRALVDQPLAADTLVALQHVNNETGIVQPVAAMAAAVHAAGGVLLCDCAQSAGKIDLPEGADMIAVSAHKFGGPPGIGALLVRDLAMLEAVGGQEQGYRPGTENMPGALAMAAALEEGRGWMARAAVQRARLDSAIVQAGGMVVAAEADRIATIAGYRMPGVPARIQLIRFDMAGIAVSAGAACSSGTLRTSPVLRAMGWSDAEADEAIRVSFGPATSDSDIDAFIDNWCAIAKAARP